MGRDTSRGRDAALAAIRESLRVGGYVPELKLKVDSPFGPFTLDFAARRGSSRDRIAVLVQHQDANGTAEQKIPHHLLCLGWLQTRPTRDFVTAYLVASGMGWSVVPTDELFEHHVVNAKHVKIRTAEVFMQAAEKGAL